MSKKVTPFARKADSKLGVGSFFRVIFSFSARKIFPATLAGVLLFYRYLKSLKVESRQISIIIFYNIEKIVKNMQKSIYKDTNVCYADAVTDRPFC